MAVILGAFVVTGAMVFVTGLIRPLRNALQNVPSAIATAMLAAILLPFCLKSFAVAQTDTLNFALMFGCFLLAKRFLPRYAMAVFRFDGGPEFVTAALSGHYVVAKSAGHCHVKKFPVSGTG